MELTDVGKGMPSPTVLTEGALLAMWRRFSRHIGNETILKHSAMLLGNLEHMLVGSNTERDMVLQAFRDHGLSVLPDGRRIEEVALT